MENQIHLPPPAVPKISDLDDIFAAALAEVRTKTDAQLRAEVALTAGLYNAQITAVYQEVSPQGTPTYRIVMQITLDDQVHKITDWISIPNPRDWLRFRELLAAIPGATGYADLAGKHVIAHLWVNGAGYNRVNKYTQP